MIIQWNTTLYYTGMFQYYGVANVQNMLVTASSPVGSAQQQLTMMGIGF